MKISKKPRFKFKKKIEAKSSGVESTTSYWEKLLIKTKEEKASMEIQKWECQEFQAKNRVAIQELR